MKIRSYFLVHAALAMQLILSPLYLDAAFSIKKEEPETKKEGYTINFDNVPIQEFLKFISKITGVNVIYNDSDMNFNVTIVSEEQTDLNNILSALVQILRIHGLTLIEEDQNLLIHKNVDVRQIPTVVSSENPLKGKLLPALMTKVFRIQKGNPSHIAALIIPMLSKDALVEVSTETRQLIITDVSSSIQTVEHLLLSLDAPETPYDVDAFSVKYGDATELATLATKIITPIADATTLEIIPQTDTNTIYIVSTPFLIEKTLSVLADLDKQGIAFHKQAREIGKIAQNTQGTQGSLAAPSKNLSAENILVYKLQSKSPEEIETDLKKMVQAASTPSFDASGLNSIVQTMKYIKSANSFIFVGTPNDLHIISSFLSSVDLPMEKILEKAHEKAHEKAKEAAAAAPLNAEFLIYNPKNTTTSYLKNLVMETAVKLKSANLSDPVFLKTLESVKELPSSNQLVFTGDKQSLERLSNVLETLDQSTPRSNSEVFVYKLHYLTADELTRILLGIAEHADNSQPSSDTESMLKAINSMRVIQGSNAVQFVATPATILQIKNILTILDVPENTKSLVTQKFGTNFLVYKLKFVSSSDLLSQLKQIVKDAPHQDTLLKSIAGAQYSSSSNSIIFTGEKNDLDKIQVLLESLDVGQEKAKAIAPIMKISPTRQAEGYKIYKPSFVSGAELITMVKSFEDHLVASGVTDHNLSEVIDHLSFVDRTNTIILTGKEKDITQVIELLKEFDTQETATGKLTKHFDGGVETIDDTGFLIYKLQYQSGQGIVAALTVISSDLGNQTTQKKNTSLVEAIRSTQWIEATNSLIATGQPRVLAKLKELIQSIDQPLKQVFIEVLVVESNNSDDLEIGLSWGSQGAIHNRFSWGSGNYNQVDATPIAGAPSANSFAEGLNAINATRQPAGTDIPPILGGFFGVIGDIIWHQGKSYASLGSLVRAFRETNTVTEVLSQKIVAQDNQNAKIFSGSNIPFTGSLVTTSGLSQTTNANLEYRNVGITLSITPIIGDNDIVTLDIDYEMSEQANTGTGSGGNVTQTQANSINGITTTKTSMQTKVHLPDRHFLVLSGTMQNISSRTNNGIPCLGGLPLIGAAFSYDQKFTENQNVIIFVKPHIIKTQQIYGQITKEQEEIYGSKDQTCPEDFQNGLELIRSADDIDPEDNE